MPSQPLTSEFLNNIAALEALFENTPDAIFVERFDPPLANEAGYPGTVDGIADIVYANPSFYQLLERHDLAPGKDLSPDSLWDQLTKIFDKDIEHRWSTRTGQTIDNIQLAAHLPASARKDFQLMLSTTPIKADGVVVGCWTRITDATPAVVQDATEQRALRHIEAFVRTENVPLICLAFATPLPPQVPAQQLGIAYFGATVTHITESAAALFEGTPESILNKRVAELESAQPKVLLENAFPSSENGEMLNLGDTKALIVEMGTEPNVLTYRVKPTFVFDKGYAIEAWIRVEDITYEEFRARRLETLEQTKAMAMAAASLHQFETGYKDGELYIEATGLDELRLAPLPTDIEGWREALRPEMTTISTHEIRDLFEGKITELNFILRLPNLDGGETHLEIWGLVNPQAPESTASTLGLYRDVTEREKLHDRLSEKKTLEGLGVLAGGVAHDFNNLLMSVLGYAELMEADLVDATDRDAHQSQQSALQNISEIRTAALRASELCTSLLAYAGQHLIEKKPLDLTELVRSTAELVDVTIGKRVPLLIDLDNEIRISADRGQLTRVIINLVGNAADAMEGYSGAVRLSTSTLLLSAEERALIGDQLIDPAERMACISVRDDGCGMSSETKQRIYEPFFTTKDEGRGLGMAAVHGIVKNHGGVILVESALGQGTEFRICLPLLARTPTAEYPILESPAEASIRRPRVLVVDDEAGVRTIASEMLRHLNCDVLEADSAESAFYLFGHHEFDYAMLDITMPVMSGTELAELLLERRPNLKVVLCSGYTDKDVPEALLARCAFIHKPFTLKEVSDTLGLKTVMGEQAVPV